MNFHRVGLVSIDTKGPAPGPHQERIYAAPDCVVVDDVEFQWPQC